jgi:uncharacterized OB-fold protein
MHIAQNWRIKGQRYALKGAQCEKCNNVTFPPREVCPHCEAMQVKGYKFDQARTLSVTPVAMERAAR